MSLRDDLEAVRDRTLSRLNDQHDYFTYTKGAWRTLQLAVQRDGLKFSFQNLTTKSTVTQSGIYSPAPSVTSRMTWQQPPCSSSSRRSRVSSMTS